MHAPASPAPPTRLISPITSLSGYYRNLRLIERRRLIIKCRRTEGFDQSPNSSASSRAQSELFPISFPSSETFPARLALNGFLSSAHPRRSVLPYIKCEKDDKTPKYVSVERAPYHVYLDSTSGELEPASGARASIPGPEYWTEGTADLVRVARAPEPKGVSTSNPSFGKTPGSRRKRYKASSVGEHSANQSGTVDPAIAAHSADQSGVVDPALAARSADQSGVVDPALAARSADQSGVVDPALAACSADQSRVVDPALAAHHADQSGVVDPALTAHIVDQSGVVDQSDIFAEPMESSSEYVVYQTETQDESENLDEFDLNKKLGRPHAFIDPKVRRPKGESLSSEELWWHWRNPKDEFWSRWQRRRPDVETVFLKAMAETGQVKLYGDHPTITETSLYRARRHLFKEERVKAEKERLKEIGPLAYYSEWVKAWKKDTSREAVQKHFEETGEDENTQLIEMFSHQTDREFRVMMGTDVRIQRDPLAMRMREDQIKQIWGGDPVYPTINYIQDPHEDADFRGPDFHEPTPGMVDYLMERGVMIPREELEELLGKKKKEEPEVTEIDDAMARAVDIGEADDGEGSDVEEEDDAEENSKRNGSSDAEVKDEPVEKLNRNWSVLKSTPQLRKSKEKPKKDGPMSLEEAIDESENLTDFLLDFDNPDE
ncbi:PLASTID TRANSCRIPTIONALLY ACTIVE 12, chloroplastic-like protein [Drosera capensis]